LEVGSLFGCVIQLFYSADGSLNAAYLTGLHTWYNLVDMDKADPPALPDFPAFLDFLRRYDHNFIRPWTRGSEQ
jgi:hypothetical protein